MVPEGADLTDGQPVGQQSVINIPDSERVPVKHQNEFASLPTEIATVGKLIRRRNNLEQWKLRPKKIEFASLPRFLSRGGIGVVRPPTD